jgi:hypothetical protein
MSFWAKIRSGFFNVHFVRAWIMVGCSVVLGAPQALHSVIPPREDMGATLVRLTKSWECRQRMLVFDALLGVVDS